MASSSSSWDLLDPEEENSLHKSRLFSIEEKPFKRITKRLATINQLANSNIRQNATPPPEQPPPLPQQQQPAPSAPSNGDEPAENDDTDTSAPNIDFPQLKEDITLDFAAYDYTIGRLQFLLSANEAQRARYAAERIQILETCARVRDSTAALRGQLAAAQETRAQRQAWDGQARAILENKALQERPKAIAGIDKLEEECRQLEAESETYAVTWRERKEQFSRIMDESMRLRRLIRDEKEEVERREGMDEDGEGSGEGDGHTPRPGSASGNATPRPDGGGGGGGGGSGVAASAVPKGLMEDGGSTPMQDSPAPSTNEGGLKPPPDQSGNRSQAGSRSGSRDPSPARSVEPEGQNREGEDVEMSEEVASTLQITVEGQAEDKMDVS